MGKYVLQSLCNYSVFFFSPSNIYITGFAFGLLRIRNLSMNSYFIFPVICEVLHFSFRSYSSVFNVVISKAYYSFHKHYNKNLYLLDLL